MNERLTKADLDKIAKMLGPVNRHRLANYGEWTAEFIEWQRLLVIAGCYRDFMGFVRVRQLPYRPSSHDGVMYVNRTEQLFGDVNATVVLAPGWKLQKVELFRELTTRIHTGQIEVIYDDQLGLEPSPDAARVYAQFAGVRPQTSGAAR